MHTLARAGAHASARACEHTCTKSHGRTRGRGDFFKHARSFANTQAHTRICCNHARAHARTKAHSRLQACTSHTGKKAVNHSRSQAIAHADMRALMRENHLCLWHIVMALCGALVGVIPEYLKEKSSDSRYGIFSVA
uniref:Uncharacterized protein n=1 Tax=Chrysotila carterae TaxID=13221 RepID=A0A7S4BEE4_CHRCT